MQSRILHAGLVVLFALAAISIRGEEDHDHAALFRGSPPNIPPATYIIRVKAWPDSLLIRGSIELDYRNMSSDTLRDIHFAVALNDTTLDHDTLGAPYCHVDSILYRGAPLTGNELTNAGIDITVRPPGGIAPGESGPFLLTFTSRLSREFVFDKQEGIDLTRWYPEVCARIGNNWYLPTELHPDSCPREFADYNLEFEVDSAWSIAFPGELINDKKYFGLVPDLESDTAVQEDLLANFSQVPGGERYLPVFDSGFKSYYVKARSENGFPLVLHRGLMFDRAVVEGVPIMVAYSKRQKKRWHYTIASDAARFMRAYTDSLGAPLHNTLNIAPMPVEQATDPVTSMIVLPNGARNRSLLRQMLAIRTAQQWFRQPSPDTDPAGRVLDEGIACFLAITLAAPEDSTSPYYSLNDYRKWREKVQGYLDPTTKQAVRTIPGWLQLCRTLTDDSVVWNALREYSREFRHVHPPADTLFGLLRGRAGVTALPTVAQADWLLDSLDVLATSASFTPTDQGFAAKCSIYHNSPIDLPVEVGFIDDRQDTLYTLVTVPAAQEWEKAMTVDFLGARPIVAIVLDPNHRLPDFNRTNNHRFAHLSRFRYNYPPDLFPAYELWTER